MKPMLVKLVPAVVENRWAIQNMEPDGRGELLPTELPTLYRTKRQATTSARGWRTIQGGPFRVRVVRVCVRDQGLGLAQTGVDKPAKASRRKGMK